MLRWYAMVASAKPVFGLWFVWSQSLCELLLGNKCKVLKFANASKREVCSCCELLANNLGSLTRTTFADDMFKLVSLVLLLAWTSHAFPNPQRTGSLPTLTGGKPRSLELEEENSHSTSGLKDVNSVDSASVRSSSVHLNCALSSG